MKEKNRSLKKLMKKILSVTMDIRNKFPALYEHLNETPLLIEHGNKEASLADFSQYLEALTLQLKTFALRKKALTP